MIDIDKLNFNKMNGLIPSIILDDRTKKVLMLGFMNIESLRQTLLSGKVTFFSRSKNRLWTKGETSGNYLSLVDIFTDCDNDSLLIYANPEGNTCHLNKFSCFDSVENKNGLKFIEELFELIKSRKALLPDNSYTTKLFQQGENRIIQKVGEEAIETVIAAKNNDKNEIINEVSDLIYHLFVMLVDKNIEFSEVVKNLEERHQK